MKKILLVCCAGMSTSLLVTKMEGAAKEKKLIAKSGQQVKKNYQMNLPKNLLM